MLEGFEKETKPLTEREFSVLTPMVEYLQRAKGKQNAVRNEIIIRYLFPQTGISLNQTAVRKLINYIRKEGLITNLMATSSGYYVSSDVKELQKYVKSLEGRENEIRRVRLSIEAQIKLLSNVSSTQEDTKLCN
jgi:hypothetical protein